MGDFEQNFDSYQPCNYLPKVHNKNTHRIKIHKINVTNVFKVKNKDTKTMSIKIVTESLFFNLEHIMRFNLVFLLWTFNKFLPVWVFLL